MNTQFMHVIESAGTDPMGPYTYKGKLVGRNALDGTVLQLDGKMYAVYSVWNETQDLAIREMSSPWETVGDERGVFAPGHDTFFKSPDGTEDWMAYHANDQESEVCDMGRTPRIQQFTRDADGKPNFGMPVAESTELAVPSR